MRTKLTRAAGTAVMAVGDGICVGIVTTSVGLVVALCVPVDTRYLFFPGVSLILAAGVGAGLRRTAAIPHPHTAPDDRRPCLQDSAVTMFNHDSGYASPQLLLARAAWWAEEWWCRHVSQRGLYRLLDEAAQHYREREPDFDLTPQVREAALRRIAHQFAHDEGGSRFAPP